MQAMMSGDPDPMGTWWNTVNAVKGDSTSTALKALTMYNLTQTTDGQSNGISVSLNANQTANEGFTPSPVMTVGILHNSRTVTPANANWRSDEGRVNINCSDDGFSWPHRTLGWKMLKDDLFGIDINSAPGGAIKLVSVGETRVYGSNNSKAHDVDSVCLDCHNPTIWNATSSATHTDTADNPYNDDLLMRGLP